MRKVFMCSLCHGGIIGGALYLDEQAVTFVCQKLTVDSRFKKLVLPLKEIEQLSWKQAVFPLATFRMKSGEEYKFLLFNRQRFEKYYQELRPQ